MDALPILLALPLISASYCHPPGVGLTVFVIVMVAAQVHQGSLSKDRWKVSQSLTKLLLTMESC